MVKISVIIPTYNEEDVIDNCLESLSKQTLKDFEVIVVDDGSTDDTKSVVSKVHETTYKIQILEQNHKGAGAARNLGSKRAKGQILVFVDADMTFDKKFLQKLVAPIVALRAHGTFSKDEYVSNWENIWARCWNINQNWESKKRHPKKYPDTQKVFRAILKKEFYKVNGFTPGGYNDDWSLSEKLGYEAANAPNAFFFHKNPSTLREVFNHAKWVGKRTYKFGVIGKAFSLFRSSFPASLIVGIFKSVIKKEPMFIIFKVVYDFGVLLGIILSMRGKLAK